MKIEFGNVHISMCANKHSGKHVYIWGGHIFWTCTFKFLCIKFSVSVKLDFLWFFPAQLPSLFGSYFWASCSELLFYFKGALTSWTSSPNIFQKKLDFYTIRSVAWVMTACRVLRPRLTYFWKYMNICSIFYFSKSTSIYTQYSSLWTIWDEACHKIPSKMKTHW